MKLKLFYILFFVFIFSCKDLKNKESNAPYNGIDSQVLALVDSIYLNRSENDEPFVTFDCYSYNDTTYLGVNNGLSFPVECFKITECPLFMGYKKYNDVYLVFYDSSDDSFMQNYVIKDSLTIDEYPFERYKVYDIKSKFSDPPKIWQWVYRIDEHGDLIFVNNGWPLPN